LSAELRVENLRKVFSTGKPAVDDVSFRVAAGEIVVLLGPSGCGKTTTLRCVAGLEHPTAGRIAIANGIVSEPERNILIPPRLREVGMVFQSYAVWPHMTVFENVAYPLRHRKMSGAAIKARVGDVLELVGLAEYAARSVVALSGGQMQRVALARSLVYEPKILLLDEPLSNLDAKLRLRLRDDLRQIIKRTGVTALYVTHDQAEAVVLGDRIGVMREGKLLQLAGADEIYNRPADLFVANFTGASNLLPGKVLSRQGENGTVAMASGEALHAWLAETVSVGEAVKLSVRPENLLLRRAGEANGATNSFPGKVLAQRYQGTQTIYEVSVLGGRIDALELGTATRFAVGEAVNVVMPPHLCWAYHGTDTVDFE
jgi:iron(III) transport system ATP-binding protein